MIRHLFVLNVLIFLLISFPAFLINNEASASAPAPTVSTFTIESSKDDAWSKKDDVNWADDKYYLSRADRIAGCRWRIDIPKGSSILHAYFVCRARSDSADVNNVVRIQVFDQDSCDDFDDIFWDWPVMEEYVDWQLPSFSKDIWYTSPDIKSLIQAYVNRTGYKSGNYIGLRFEPQKTSPAEHEVWSWDGDVESAAKLEVTYIPPQPPFADFTYVPSNPLVNENVVFNASASYSLNGSITKYCWNFSDGTPIVNETDSIITHKFENKGLYEVTLTVVDSNGLTNSTTKTVEVYESLPPTATFTYFPINPLVNESIIFNASESSDPNGYISIYKWDFGDGNITLTTTTVVSHVYYEPGEYNVNLTVTDNDNESSSVWKVLCINLHDIAVIGVNIQCREVQIGQLTNITVTVKNGGTTPESFNVTVFCNETIVGRQIVIDLPSGTNKTLIFQWNTSDVSDTANFTVRAEASIVSGEQNVEDNTYPAGTIRVVKVEDNALPSSQLDWRWMLIGILSAILLGTGFAWKRRAKPKVKGFEFFDEITGGGIPDSFSVLILGNPGSGKSVLCQQLNYKFLSTGKPCIYVTYDCFPNEIRENIKCFHWDISKYEKEGKFVFIDCFSPIAKVRSEEKFFLNQPFSLSELGIVMSKAVNETGDAPKVFLDSIGSLLTYVDSQKVLEFLQARSARIKGINGTFIFTVGKETIKSDLVNLLEEVVDCVIELDVKISGERVVRKMRIKKMRGKKTSEKWVRFEIIPERGIVFPV